MKNWRLALKLKSMLEQHFRQVPQSIAADIVKVLDEHDREESIRPIAEVFASDHPLWDTGKAPATKVRYGFDEEPPF